MDRGHLEDALAMRQLEVAHLQDIGQRLNDVDEAHKQQHERHIERIGKAAHRAAEIQRAGVAHKRLGGVEIIEQEAAERADKRRRERGKAPLLCRHGHEREEQHHGKRHARGKAVDAVRQVDGVDAADDDEHGQRQIDQRRDVDERLPDKRDIEIIRQGIRKMHAGKEQAGRQHLQNELLQARQAEIALFLHLDEVIGKADQAEHQRQRQHKQVLIVAGLAHGMPAGDDAQKRRQNKDDAAHGRRARLALMPLRADFPDGLARLQRAQRRNKPPAEQQRQNEAAQHRNKDPDQRRFHFSFPHMFFRF